MVNGIVCVSISETSQLYKNEIFLVANFESYYVSEFIISSSFFYCVFRYNIMSSVNESFTSF